MSSRNIPQPSTYIVDPLLPTREIQLIAGGSGSGKSTLACQIAFNLLNCGEFFGTPIERPQKVAYLAFDRSELGMRRTFERTLSTEEIPFPFYSAITSNEFSEPKYQTATGAVARLLELHPETDVLIVDGIGMAFKGDSSSLGEVSQYIHQLIRMLHKLPRDLTIIALHHMGKTKKGNEYAQARQRLHGSVGWAATCETCILIEPESEADPENPHRLLTICPRNAPERVYTYTFDEDGRLVQSATLTNKKTKYQSFLESVQALPEQTDIATSELELIASPLDISTATLKRHIAQLVQDSILYRVRRGFYQRISERLIQ